MVTIFPKVTKCSFENFGVSGTIQKYRSVKKLNTKYSVLNVLDLMVCVFFPSTCSTTRSI